MHASKAISQRLVAKMRKCFVAFRDVEETMYQMRARARPRHRGDSGLRLKLRCDDVRDVVEARGNAGHRIQRAVTAVQENLHSQARDIFDRDMIAPLLAFAEEGDGLAFGGLAPEAVRPVAAVRIAPRRRSGSDAGRERPLRRHPENELTRSVHHAVHGRRRDHRALRDRIGVVGVDRIGADVEQVRRRFRGKRLTRRLGHAQIVDQLGRGLGRRDGGHEHDRVARGQTALQLLGAAGREQIRFFARETRRRNA